MRLIISGGGTAGHVSPALAIVDALRAAAELDVHYVGTSSGLEADLVPRAGLPFTGIAGGGIVGKGFGQALTGAAFATQGLGQALAVLRRFRPHAVVGTGGYVSGPVVFAAAMLRIPALIQEQNVFPGVTNRLLSPLVAAVAVPFPEAAAHFPRVARRRLLVTGNPVREAVLRATRAAGREAFGLDEGRPVVYVTGGSRGAPAINEAAARALPALLAVGTQVIWSTGKDRQARAMDQYRQAGGDPGHPGLRAFPYIYQPELAMAAADLAVSRAGAATVAELTCRGLPSVLIPSPHVAHDHQQFNAEVLERSGAAQVVRESCLEGTGLAQLIRGLLDNGRRLQAMSVAARGLGCPKAADDIARAVLSLARR
ncbi:MAG: undecaprenyldiphospho-muramoylpentapeptide beta-N-acetylglucosaminyltransferase [Bacillota bacterium]